MPPKVKMSLSHIVVDYQSRWYPILNKVEKFIINHFFSRRCYACKCGDCQLGNNDREYWYCPHLKNNICTICCVHDSCAPDRNYKECAFCWHDKDREK